MKNPILHVKHLWKDPINNIEEANTRKKEVMPWLLGSVGAAVLFCGLGGALGIGILSVFGFVGIVGVMVFGFLLEMRCANVCRTCGGLTAYRFYAILIPRMAVVVWRKPITLK